MKLSQSLMIATPIISYKSASQLYIHVHDVHIMRINANMHKNK